MLPEGALNKPSLCVAFCTNFMYLLQIIITLPHVIIFYIHMFSTSCERVIEKLNYVGNWQENVVFS